MDFLKVSVIVLFVLLTIFTIKIHPEIHQPMLIEDADFKLVRISDTLENTPVTVAQTKPTQQTVTVTQPEQRTVEIKVQEPKTVETKPQVVETKPIKIKLPKKEVPVQTSTPEPSQMELLQRLLNTDIEDTKALQENAQKLAQTMQEPPKQQTKPQAKPQPKPQPSANKNPYMTEQEEIIAWSKWRSDIHNQIMKDSNIGYAPYGVLFTFNFLVDKYGNVSNIKVSATPSQYMDIARNGVKPAISRLQKQPILNFPKGTRRTSTVVNGAFSVGVENRFSTPSQFSDFERVVH